MDLCKEYEVNGIKLKAGNPDPRVIRYLESQGKNVVIYNGRMNIQLKGFGGTFFGQDSEFAKKLEVEDSKEILDILNQYFKASNAWEYATRDVVFWIRGSEKDMTELYKKFREEALSEYCSLQNIENSEDWCLRFGVTKEPYLFDLLTALKQRIVTNEREAHKQEMVKASLR